jgi:hypothetical protein
MMKRRARNRAQGLQLGVVCLALAWLALRSAPAAACQVDPNPWFNEVATLDTHTLPPELSVTVFNNELDLHRPVIEIVALGDTALSVVPNDSDVGYLSNFTRRERRSEPDKDRTSITIYPLYFDAYLREYKEQNPSADGRPADIAIPSTQHGTLTLRYDAETFAVPMTFTYSLNEDYVPDILARAGCSEAPSGLSEGVATLALLALFLVILASVIVLRWHRARASGVSKQSAQKIHD